MTFWLGVIVGLLVGVPAGMFALSLCVMAGRGGSHGTD
jgi:Na+/H+ antiporter NhaA